MISFLDQIISQPVAQAITWTLIHSIWQVSLVVIIMSFFLNLYEEEPSIVRYRISKAALYMIALISMVTFLVFYIYFSENFNYEVFTIHLSDTRSHYIGPSVDESSGYFSWFTQYIFPNSTVITSCWLLGFAVFAFRFFGGYMYTRYIIHSSQPLRHSAILTIKERAASQLKVSKNINLATSKIISTPMVIGFFKPYLLLPFGVVNHLTLQEVEAIFAHEIAHIKRNDYLHNIVQLIVEAIFYFHPGVWWISSHIRMERENCCDDIAIAYLGDRNQYAKSLLKLEQLQQRRSAPQFSMTLIRKGKLLNRISRILNHPVKNNKSMDRIVITSLICLMFIVLGFSNKSKLWSETREVSFTEAPNKNDFIVTSETVDPSVFLPILKNDPKTKPDYIQPSGEPTLNVSADVVSPLEHKRKTYVEIPILPLHMDTIPEGTNMTIIDKKMSLKIYDGKVEELILDNKVIPEEEYENYIERSKDGDITKVNDVIITLPPPPPPPSSPSSLRHLTPPAPPKAPNEPNAPLPPHFDIQDLTLKLSDIDIKVGDMDSLLSNLDITLPNHIIDKNFDHSKFYFLGDSIQSFHHNFNDSLFVKIKDRVEIDGLFDHSNGFEIHSFNTPTDAILADLRRHNFLDLNKTNKIELSAKEMKINGEKQPSNIHSKYKKMYEKKMGHPIHKDTKIVLESDQNKASEFQHRYFR